MGLVTELGKALRVAREGDQTIATTLDQLGNSLEDLGVDLVVLDSP
jgi:hypothetical protein